MKIKAKLASLALFGLILSPLALAAEGGFAPMVNGYDNANVINGQQNTLSQRLAKLESQLAGVDQLGLLQKLDAQQKEIQVLRGELEVQTHQLSELQKQIKQYYADLDQRLQGLKASPVQSTSAAVSSKQAKADTPMAAQDQEKADYQQAYGYVKANQPDSAIRAFQNFLRQYPNNQYTPNAHYWLGEMYLVQKQWLKADQQFTTVIDRFSTHPKAADAMLKQAYLLQKQDKRAAAQALLKQLVQTYPESNAAKLAQTRLEALTQASAAPDSTE